MNLIFELLKTLGVITISSVIMVVVIFSAFVIANLLKGFVKALKKEQK